MDNALYHIKIILNLGVGLHQYCNSLVSNLPEHFNISFKLYKTSLADAAMICLLFNETVGSSSNQNGFWMSSCSSVTTN